MNLNNINKILSIVDRMRDVVCVCINEVIHNLTHKEGTNNKISNYCGALIIKVSVKNRFIEKVLTSDGDLLISGTSKHPLNLPHNFAPTSGSRQSICRTKPHGVSQINSNGGYFKERNTNWDTVKRNQQSDKARYTYPMSTHNVVKSTSLTWYLCKFMTWRVSN